MIVGSAENWNITRLRLAKSQNFLANRDTRLTLSTRKEHASLSHNGTVHRIAEHFRGVALEMSAGTIFECYSG